ncbi:MBL fold metallo-hydrolase [Bradyrhizobium symbiodeficiens]|uniref:MBL fold metallo-hydrolase n=1 Tax=Bradyrhizobium symbiodeficiens TaxID=1404367 RepID=UPI000BA1AA9B|nr:MBL fold metallo-hydrolase [Bradyrhizobium symbiodeficiens]AWM06130.1 MBL fold metallo-hydrolase [Bradyrhizobium symbiodeficiens]
MRISLLAIPSTAVFLCPALLAIGYAASAPAVAQSVGDYFHTGAGARYLERAKSDVITVPLRGNINVLMGSGGNIVVLSGSDGKFLVDAGIKPSKDKLQAALDKINPSPLKYVVNTHWHWDHTDGNEWMHAAGATIIAQRNTLRHLSETTHVDDWNWTFAPVPAGARPTIVVDNERDFSFAGESIKVEHLGPGHTDGDLLVYFQRADIVALGDTFWNGNYPFIDNEDGGSVSSAISWASKAIERTTDKTILIPGHGEIGNRAQLIEFRDMLIAVRDQIATLKSQGKSLEEVMAARPTAAFDDKWGRFVINPKFFTKLVYEGL